MRHLDNNASQQGSMLVALMIFMVVGITVAASSVLLVVDATVGVTVQQSGNQALDLAESGAENAILRLLRDPQYTGEVLEFDEGSITISITGENPYTVRSVGQVSTAQRSVEVVVARQEGVWVVEEWYETE